MNDIDKKLGGPAPWRTDWDSLKGVPDGTEVHIWHTNGSFSLWRAVGNLPTDRNWKFQKTSDCRVRYLCDIAPRYRGFILLPA